MKTKELVLFYIQPMDSDTNGVIAHHLQQEAAESAAEDVKCEDGVTRNLWKISYDDFVSLILSRKSLRLNCNFFTPSENGPKYLNLATLAIDDDADFPAVQESVRTRITIDGKTIAELLDSRVRALKPSRGVVPQNARPPVRRNIKPNRERRK